MFYSTIMVQLDIDEDPTQRLAFATELARRFEADLVAFAAAQVRIPVPAAGSEIAAGEMLRRETVEIEQRLELLREAFHGAVGDSQEANWRGFVGDPTRLLALHARAADLIVTGPTGTATDPFRSLDIGHLIVSAGRPILMAAEGLTPVAAKNVLVGWKDTREARRALRDAMPFLTGAGEVVVVGVAEDDPRAEREALDDVVRFLIRHGARARSHFVEAQHGDAGAALGAAAAETGADLLVTGGYGRSRLREWIFGGVTKTLLATDTLHRLVSN